MGVNTNILLRGHGTQIGRHRGRNHMAGAIGQTGKVIRRDRYGPVALRVGRGGVRFPTQTDRDDRALRHIGRRTADVHTRRGFRHVDIVVTGDGINGNTAER